jgi:predicted DNA binding CopG/RHH family protein
VKKNNLDTEERDVLTTYERDEWQSIPLLEAEIAAYQAFAAEQSKHMRLVNVMLSQEDWEGIQKKARAEGIRYDTLISNIVHQFVKDALRQ